MLDKESLHKKVQELADCYATNDPLKEMSELPADAEKGDAALKWLALAALHAVTAGAKKIELRKSPGGAVTVTAKYSKSTLPSPGEEIGPQIIEAVRGITHLEGDKGKGLVALGIRNDSLEVEVELERKADGEETLELKFPG